MKSHVRLKANGHRLELNIPNGSELLAGEHRIYFENVLGLTENTKRLGFYFEGETEVPILSVEIVRYLAQLGVSVELDTYVQTLVDHFQANVTALDSARKVGIRIKRTPPKSIVVPGLRRPLKPYQIPAVQHLVDVDHAANFSVPGSGKTSIVLSAFWMLKRKKKVDKLVMIGPRASFVPWEDELKTCFHKIGGVLRITGSKASRKKLFREGVSKDILLISYQAASNDASDLIGYMRRHRTMLVLDESHNIKRFEGGKWAESLLMVSRFAIKRVILTGTPAPNSLLDLWSQLTFLWPDPQILGDREEFKSKVAREDKETIESLRNEVRPFYWRIRKRDLGLPRPRFHRLSLTMKQCQKLIYRALAAKVLSDLVRAPDERERLRIWRRARMIRLLQAASNPSLLVEFSTEFQVPPLGASGMSVDGLIQNYSKFEVPRKIEYAIKLARELVRRGNKVILWTVFVHNIKTLERALADLEPRIVFGEIPKDEKEDVEFNREKMIHEFKTYSKFPVLIANPTACAESISLHKVCKHAIYLDRTYNCAQFVQSMDRIHRVGLTNRDHIHYYLLKSKDTIDDVIDKRLHEKQVKMLRLLDDDFGVLDLDSTSEDMSEESEQEADFNSLVDQLLGRNT